MSKNYLSKEDAINQLYETIKTKFEQDGVLQDVRCMLQSKMVSMMRGQGDTMSLVAHTTSGYENDLQANESRITMLHQLIMEYFHWHGFHYTAEMFATESGCENIKPVRECVEGALGHFKYKNLPIILELVSDLMDRKK